MALPEQNNNTRHYRKNSWSKASKVMMDQQNFEAARPASADPAVALAQALGQLPKATPSKASLAKTSAAAKPGMMAKTSVEALAGELGLKLGDQNELTIRRIKRGKNYSFVRANGTHIRHVGTICMQLLAGGGVSLVGFASVA